MGDLSGMKRSLVGRGFKDARQQQATAVCVGSFLAMLSETEIIAA